MTKEKKGYKFVRLIPYKREQFA